MRSRTKGFAVAWAVVLALVTPLAGAAVIVTTSGGAGTVSVADGVFASFNPPFGTARFEMLIVGESFSSVGTLTHSVNVPTQGDLHFVDAFGPGLRWVETVTNNTGVAWSGFTFALDPDPAPPLFYPDSPTNVPSFAVLTGSGTGVTNVALQGPTLANGWTLAQNPADTLITVNFSAALLDPGESFSVYFALANVPINRSFTLTETPLRVPEPGTLALLGIGLAGLGFARRVKKRL